MFNIRLKGISGSVPIKKVTTIIFDLPLSLSAYGADNDERVVNLTLSPHLFLSTSRTDKNSPLCNNF